MSTPVDDHLECKVCYEAFNHNDKKPMALQCGHTFCRTCTDKLHSNGSIKCPLDNKAMRTTLDAVPVNYAVLGMIEESKDVNLSKASVAMAVITEVIQTVLANVFNNIKSLYNWCSTENIDKLLTKVADGSPTIFI